MSRFYIVTPTIGRKTLRRCLESLDDQIHKDFVHVVVGDGPQESWVKEFCAKKGAIYLETEAKEPTGSYGAAPRNLALNTSFIASWDYAIFLDDDNVLLEPALYQINKAIVDAHNPALLYQEILFTNKYKEWYYIIPKEERLMVEGEWDLLNAIYRRDVIKDVTFKPSYKNDYLFAQDVASRYPSAQWVKVRGVGGIHHLSWDTYHG